MATNNRASRINRVVKVVKKQYQPVPTDLDRPVLDHLLYACLLENSLHSAADQVFDTLKRDYFDWNEVRVSTVNELSDVLKPLNDPVDAARRLKRVLQSLFETHYSFDLELMRKQNIGQTVKQLGAYKGATSFTVAYVTQHALGGHSIPINSGLLTAMHVVGVVSDAEAAKHTVPGLERVVQKSKGLEIGALLHQLGAELHRSPYGPTIRKLLLEIDPKCKDNLPKRPSKKPEPAPVPEKVAKKQPPAKTPPTKTKPAPTEKKAKKPVTKKAKVTTTKKTPAKKRPVKKTPVKKGATKKPSQVKKKVVKKKTTKTKAPKTKGKKQTATKRLTRRKPR